jgi:hypothetical protein
VVVGCKDKKVWPSASERASFLFGPCDTFAYKCLGNSRVHFTFYLLGVSIKDSNRDMIRVRLIYGDLAPSRQGARTSSLSTDPNSKMKMSLAFSRI